MKFEWPRVVWEQIGDQQWASRPVTDDDRVRRREAEANWQKGHE